MRTTILLLGIAVCSTFAVSVRSGETDQIDLGRESLDTVWQTVCTYHYDSTFGGLDWQEIHERYRKLAAAAEDDEALIRLMNEMLLELKLSHYAVFQMDDKVRSGSPLISEACIGLDLRLYEDEAVITSLRAGFPAAEAGMKPGCAIRAVNGTPVKQLLDDAAARHVPHFNKRQKISSMCDEVVRHCYGRAGDTVVISYEDESGIGHDVTLQMRTRGKGTKIAEHFPTVYVDFRSRKLSDDIGYIYFSAVLPPADSLFLQALDEMSDVRGLIIDMRGNPGGMHEVGETIAARLIGEKTLFSVFQYRDSTSQVIIEPNPPIFDGPIAILIDVMNGSASERFSACMQSIGRATIIGERSPGSVGPSDVKELPNGASFMYLIAQSLTPDGTVLEGHGVTPDIAAPLDRAALLSGRDTQIEQAITFLESRID